MLWGISKAADIRPLLTEGVEDGQRERAKTSVYVDAPWRQEASFEVIPRTSYGTGLCGNPRFVQFLAIRSADPLKASCKEPKPVRD